MFRRDWWSGKRKKGSWTDMTSLAWCLLPIKSQDSKESILEVFACHTFSWRLRKISEKENEGFETNKMSHFVCEIGLEAVWIGMMADFQIWGLKNLPHTSHTSVIPDDTVKRRNRAASLPIEFRGLSTAVRRCEQSLNTHETIAEKS